MKKNLSLFVSLFLASSLLSACEKEVPLQEYVDDLMEKHGFEDGVKSVSLDNEEVADLKLFMDADQKFGNSDGQVTKDELKAFYKSFDSDHDGMLGKYERVELRKQYPKE